MSNPIKPKPIKTVWVISDGIAGHFNQSKGILLALEQIYNLKVEWLDLHLKRGLYRRILSVLLNHIQPPIHWLPYFYHGEFPVGRPDIVVGAGGKSSFAVAWLGKVFKAQTIFAGSLRQLNSKLFNAVLVLEPIEQPPFISLQTSPMSINQLILKQAADAWLVAHGKPVKTLWAMLIGGDGAGATYSQADWQNLAGQMNSLAEKNDIQWLVSTSRRTGKLAEQVLQQHLKSEVIAQAVWWSVKPQTVTQAYLGLSEVAFCTIDSMSMLMESISAMRPVVAVKPEHFEPEHNFQAAISRLEQQQLLLKIQIIELTQKSYNIFMLKPLKLEPSIILAQHLAARLEF